MKTHAKTLVGLAVTVFFLWLALHDVPWHEVWTHFRAANLPLLLAGIVVSTLGVHVRAMRWRSLLAPVRPDTPFRARIAGTAVGFALNNLLPARVGEFARAVVCARVAGIKVGSVFGTLVVERTLDGIVCIGLLFGVIALEGFPATSEGVTIARNAAWVAGVVVVGLAVMLVLLAAFPERTARVVERVADRVLPARLRRPVIDAMHAFMGGLGALRSPALFAQSVAWVLFQWLFLGVSFLLAMAAFGITSPGYAGALFLQSFVSLAVSIPSAPGFWGVFEAASKYGLALYGVDQARALAFGMAFHLGGWLTVTALGLYYIFTLKLGWKELKGSEERVEVAVESDPALNPPPAAPARA